MVHVSVPVFIFEAFGGPRHLAGGRSGHVALPRWLGRTGKCSPRVWCTGGGFQLHVFPRMVAPGSGFVACQREYLQLAREIFSLRARHDASP